MARDILSTQNFVGGAKITGLPAATAAGEAVVFEQFNSAIEGIAWKDSVRVATQADLNLASPGATVDGITMAAGDRVLVRAQTSASQNGIYLWNGAATPMTRAPDASTSAELEAATAMVEEGTSAGATYRQTSVNFVLDSGAVAFTLFGTSAGAATEAAAGIAEIATQAETDAGSDDSRIVTPAKLANHSGRIRKMTGTVGDGSATTYTITHNFNRRDVQVEVYKNSGNYDTVICDVTRPSVNTVVLTFASAPSASAYAYSLLA
jgi:hypothetical protein